MDWQGQKIAELVMQVMLLLSGLIAFLTGYALGSFQMMVALYAGGVVFTTLVTVPNWPFFNRHPLNWLDPIESDKHPKPQPQVPFASKKRSAKKIEPKRVGTTKDACIAQKNGWIWILKIVALFILCFISFVDLRLAKLTWPPL